MEPLKFEHTMKLFFRDNAHQIAGAIGNIKERKKWLLKAVKKMMKVVKSFDTSHVPLKHQEVLMSNLESFKNEVTQCESVNWSMIDDLLRLSAKLLGFNCRGRIYSLCYWQEENQRGTEMIDESLYLSHENRNAISVKKRLVKQLVSEGFDTFTIALVFGVSEYAVKKMKKEN